jgi:hypothetical protein
MAKHRNTHLPTPGVNLIVWVNGKQMRAIRPGYISDRLNHDQGYRTHNGEIINKGVGL